MVDQQQEDYEIGQSESVNKVSEESDIEDTYEV